MFDFSLFTTVEAWVSLFTLIFLEIVLGVDNIVFIALTTNRLPEEKQHLGRKLGLAGALIMRILFLCGASYLIHLTNPLFTINLGFYSHGFSIRDLILFAGGIYLLYKGATELKAILNLEEEKEEQLESEGTKAPLSMASAIATIMVMDLVFSIDSVITAVGLAQHLIIMIIAVMLAVVLMMLFIDQISTFINKFSEMKILAITFIILIGLLLSLDGMGLHSNLELLDMHVEKLMVYCAMVFSLVLELIQMKYRSNLEQWQRELNKKASDEDKA